MYTYAYTAQTESVCVHLRKTGSRSSDHLLFPVLATVTEQDHTPIKNVSFFKENNIKILFEIFFFFFWSSGASGGQGSITSHRSYLSHCTDHTGSLTCCATRELQKLDIFILFHLFIYLFILVFWLFRAAPAAYGSAQARGRIGAVAAGLYHSNTRSQFICDLPHSSQQRQILNPLSEARDRTLVPMDTSRVH